MGYDLKARALLNGAGDVAAARATLDTALGRVGEITVTKGIVTWPNDATGILGGAYEQRFAALTLAAYERASSADSVGYYGTKWFLWGRAGQAARARAYADSVRRVVEPMAGRNSRAPLGLAYAYAALGRRADAGRQIAAMRALRADPQAGPDVRRNGAWQLAIVYTVLNEPDSAAAELAQVVAIPHGMSATWARLDPAYAALRGRPAFEAVLARAPR